MRNVTISTDKTIFLDTEEERNMTDEGVKNLIESYLNKQKISVSKIVRDGCGCVLRIEIRIGQN